MTVFRASSVLLLHDVPFQMQKATVDQPLANSFALFCRDSCGPPCIRDYSYYFGKCTCYRLHQLGISLLYIDTYYIVLFIISTQGSFVPRRFVAYFDCELRFSHRYIKNIFICTLIVFRSLASKTCKNVL